MVTPQGSEHEAALAPKHAGGRPSIYSPELAARVCKAIASGTTLREVCREEWAPHNDTLYEWRMKIPEFSGALAHARKMCADHLADACLGIVDDVDADAGGGVGAARVSKAREQVGVRRWLAGCLDRETYGDRPGVEVKIGTVSVAFARLSAVRPEDDE